MSSTGSSFECRLARAIRAALHDVELERDGRQLVFFFDADVIAGSLFARKQIEDDTNRQVPFTRSVVRALWLQGQLPRVRLTIPHLLELKRVLLSIQECGGVESYLHQQCDEISIRFGLASATNARERLIQLFRTLASGDACDDSDCVAELVDNLGMEEFAVIEAELAASAFYEKQLLERQIDLDGDVGEAKEHIADQDDRFDEVVGILTRMRPRRKGSNESDAASLLAIARLWARDHNSPIDYRFYTHTDVIRRFCESTPSGRQLMAKPSCELPMGATCTDSSVSAIRSSTYFILRAAFPSLAFDNSGDVPEQCQERLMLADASASLLQPETASGSYSTDSLRIAEITSGMTLGDLVMRLRNRSFTKQILMLADRRERVLDSLSRLSERIQGMGDLRSRLTSYTGEVNAVLVEDAARCARSISDTVIARNIRLHLIGVDIPDEEECDLSLRRWSAIFPSEAVRKGALARLREMCSPGQSDNTSWISGALDIFRSHESLDDVLAVVVPLLTLGECEEPLQFLERCAEPQTDSLRVSLHALKTWALSVSPTPSDTPLLESWMEFWKNVDPFEGPRSPGCDEGTRRDLCLMAGWVAVYVSSALRGLAVGHDTSSRLGQVVARGRRCVDEFLETQQSDDPLCQMAWAAKLFLLANGVWAGNDVEELSTALNECQQAVKKEPGLYLMNARYWAAYVDWQRGDRIERTLGADLSTMRNVAFERFQVAAKEATQGEH